VGAGGQCHSIGFGYLCAVGGGRVLDYVVNDRRAVGDAEQREAQAGRHLRPGQGDRDLRGGGGGHGTYFRGGSTTSAATANRLSHVCSTQYRARGV